MNIPLPTPISLTDAEFAILQTCIQLVYADSIDGANNVTPAELPMYCAALEGVWYAMQLRVSDGGANAFVITPNQADVLLELTQGYEGEHEGQLDSLQIKLQCRLNPIASRKRSGRPKRR